MPDDGESDWLAVMGRDNYAAMTGIEVLEAKPGYARARVEVSDAIKNGHGNVHGGAYFTLADYTGAIASNMHGGATMAVDCSISYLKATREGSLIAEARTVKAGRRLNFLRVDIHNDRGELVAVFQGTAMRKH